MLFPVYLAALALIPFAAKAGLTATHGLLPSITTDFHPSYPVPCPTIISTAGICSTCVVPLCEAIETITQSCGCPDVVPTITTSFPCRGACPLGCGDTHYVIETPPEARHCKTTTTSTKTGGVRTSTGGDTTCSPTET